MKKSIQIKLHFNEFFDKNVFAYRKYDAENCIKTAAKIISPAIEVQFSVGYDW